MQDNVTYLANINPDLWNQDFILDTILSKFHFVQFFEFLYTLPNAATIYDNLNSKQDFWKTYYNKHHLYEEDGEITLEKSLNIPANIHNNSNNPTNINWFYEVIRISFNRFKTKYILSDINTNSVDYNSSLHALFDIKSKDGQRLPDKPYTPGLDREGLIPFTNIKDLIYQNNNDQGKININILRYDDTVESIEFRYMYHKSEFEFRGSNFLTVDQHYTESELNDESINKPNYDLNNVKQMLCYDDKAFYLTYDGDVYYSPVMDEIYKLHLFDEGQYYTKNTINSMRSNIPKIKYIQLSNKNISFDDGYLSLVDENDNLYVLNLQIHFSHYVYENKVLLNEYIRNLVDRESESYVKQYTIEFDTYWFVLQCLMNDGKIIYHVYKPINGEDLPINYRLSNSLLINENMLPTLVPSVFTFQEEKLSQEENNSSLTENTSQYDRYDINSMANGMIVDFKTFNMYNYSFNDQYNINFNNIKQIYNLRRNIMYLGHDGNLYSINKISSDIIDEDEKRIYFTLYKVYPLPDNQKIIQLLLFNEQWNHNSKKNFIMAVTDKHKVYTLKNIDHNIKINKRDNSGNLYVLTEDNNNWNFEYDLYPDEKLSILKESTKEFNNENYLLHNVIRLRNFETFPSVEEGRSPKIRTREYIFEVIEDKDCVLIPYPQFLLHSFNGNTIYEKIINNKLIFRIRTSHYTFETDIPES